MKTFAVTLVRFPSDEQKVVEVEADSAVDACARAERLNPGSLASSADAIPAAA